MMYKYKNCRRNGTIFVRIGGKKVRRLYKKDKLILCINIYLDLENAFDKPIIHFYCIVIVCLVIYFKNRLKLYIVIYSNLLKLVSFVTTFLCCRSHQRRAPRQLSISFTFFPCVRTLFHQT